MTRPRIEYRTMYVKPPIPYPVVYSQSDSFRLQRSDLRDLRREGEDAWIESRTVSDWKRLWARFVVTCRQCGTPVPPNDGEAS